MATGQKAVTIQKGRRLRISHAAEDLFQRENNIHRRLDMPWVGDEGSLDIGPLDCKGPKGRRQQQGKAKCQHGRQAWGVKLPHKYKVGQIGLNLSHTHCNPWS